MFLLDSQYCLDVYGLLNLLGVLFDYCSIKTEDTILNPIYSNCFFNLNTYFVNPGKWNFDLKGSSEVIDLGKSSLVNDDILDRLRSIPNDLGCYEYM